MAAASRSRARRARARPSSSRSRPAKLARIDSSPPASKECAVPAPRIRFLDLPAQHATLAPDMRAAVDEVFASQAFVLGPTVARFEDALARYLGVPAVVGVGSGTDA